jgi:hypothetical protein
MIELCRVTVPLVQDGECFVYDHELGEVEPVGDERDACRVCCPNGHEWDTQHTDDRWSQP